MRTIDYDAIVQKALRGVVREILTETAEHGLTENHHYYITFITTHPWVVIPDYLKEDFPDEMVIVLQHEFWDLEVTNDNFSVTLYFDDVSERVTVPFVAIVNFIDPSVKFGLQFLPSYDEPEKKKEKSSKKEKRPVDKVTKSSSPAKDGAPPKPPAGNVISLDDFRKK
ncbi:MAG: ClpXP protease specificity-enhancing factor SspB [Holosporales bacterium]|jgi:hypothetical protein|nr:ClpXP protease specificity-enhancing factor SspB [Holosporales bacterium]